MRRTLKVLICEDNALIAMSLVDLVQELGHDCVGSVDTSAKAVEMALGKRPDLALIDLNLADGWTGPQLTRRFHLDGIVCIVISGQLEYFENDGIAAHLIDKPINEARLADCIEQLAVSDGRE